MLAGSLALGGAPSTARAQASTWYQVQGLSQFGANTLSVWGTSSADLWLAGGFQVLHHFNGASWSAPTQPPTANRYNVFGFATGQVYTTGQNGYQSGAVHSCSTTACSVVHTTSSELTGIWGRSASDLYVSGDGVIRRFNGTAWVDIPTGLSTAFNVNRLESISGGATRTFFAGRNGMVLSYDGSVLTQMLTGTSVGLNGIFALNDNLVYAVGGGGTILRYNGVAWTPVVSGTTNNLHGIFALNENSIYVTGENGTVLYWNGTSWINVNIGTGGFLGVPFALGPDQVYIPRANGQYGELITSDANLNGRLLVQGPPVSTVPEPSTALLIGGGLAIMGWTHRRRRATRTTDPAHG